MTPDDTKHAMRQCPKCKHMSLSWFGRHSAFLCLMRNPPCSYHETERDHVAGLVGAGLRIIPGDHNMTTPSASREEHLYQRCPICHGKLTYHDFGNPAVMDCLCTRTETPGWAKVGLTLGQLERIRTERDRLMNVMWEAAKLDDDHEAMLVIESQVRGRETTVWVARKSLGLPEIPIAEMTIMPREDRPKKEPEPEAATFPFPATTAAESEPAPEPVRFGDLTVKPVNAATQAKMLKLQGDVLAQLKLLERTVSDGSDALATSRAENAKLNKELLQEVRSREHCERLLSRLAVMLGGSGEWVTRVGHCMPPPHSGNLYADVPALVEEMVEENKRLRAQVEAFEKHEAKVEARKDRFDDL